jgi:hypothetical protein
VFVFFGLVATVGSAFVQTGRITALALAASLPVGMLAVGLLMINNVRDVDTDAATGKRTLAVRLGARTYGHTFGWLLIVAFVLLGPVALLADSPWPLARARRAAAARERREALPRSPPAPTMPRERGAAYVAALEATARLQLAFGAAAHRRPGARVMDDAAAAELASAPASRHRRGRAVPRAAHHPLPRRHERHGLLLHGPPAGANGPRSTSTTTRSPPCGSTRRSTPRATRHRGAARRTCP